MDVESSGVRNVIFVPSLDTISIGRRYKTFSFGDLDAFGVLSFPQSSGKVSLKSLVSIDYFSEDVCPVGDITQCYGLVQAYIALAPVGTRVVAFSYNENSDVGRLDIRYYGTPVKKDCCVV